ncbi:MAG: AraC family transcriptional regulator [Lachnospiraceae bacterium]|nr:AraC family transcriptional regulator [Lachnospiraceae bacterium]
MANLFEFADMLDHKYECFIEDHTTHYEVGLHWHYFMEILYIVEGQVRLQIGNQEFIAKPGELVVLLPSILHSISTLTDKCVYSVIKFSPGNAPDAPSHGNVGWRESALLRLASEGRDIRAHFPREMVEKTHIRAFMEQAIAEMQSQPTGYISVISSVLRIVLIELIRIWESEGLNLNSLHVDDALNIEAVPAYIDEKLGDTLRVEDLAQMCNLSYSQFSKKFKKMFGRSCKQYIEQVRLKKVQTLLTTTSMDINTISQEAGFSDASHMIRSFKSEFGITPRAYRHPEEQNI